MEGTQRRRFTRIHFQSKARFRINTSSCECEVCDLSLKGAMIEVPAGVAVASGAAGTLELRLDEEETIVRMEGTIVHAKDGRIGLACREIDLDSITHLRRLIELNLGDPQLLNREFSALLDQ